MEQTPVRIDGRAVTTADSLPVRAPYDGRLLGHVPVCDAPDVDRAVRAAADAFPTWSETPPVVRARTMFAFKAQLEQHFEELARLVTTEHGKTLDDARGEIATRGERTEPGSDLAHGHEERAFGVTYEDLRGGRRPPRQRRGSGPTRRARCRATAAPPA